MKKRVIAISTLALIVLAVGMTSAWFLASESEANKFKMGTVEVEVVEPGFNDLTGIQAGTHNKNVKVVSRGTKRTYVRVSLVPEWSEPSLPISNVQLNLSSSDWVDGGDGFYYYKYYLTKNQETSLLLQSVTFTSVGPEYNGKTLTIKASAEGVQITHDAWKDIWGRTSLPFTPGIPKP
jgi:hypothetical protein